MTEGKENNAYKDALSDAMTAIQRERDSFVGSPSSAITRAVSTNGGWDCSSGDAWSDQCTHELSGVLAAFSDAYDVMESAHSAEPDEVDADDPDEWRGRRYVQATRPSAHGPMQAV